MRKPTASFRNKEGDQKEFSVNKASILKLKSAWGLPAGSITKDTEDGEQQPKYLQVQAKCNTYLLKRSQANCSALVCVIGKQREVRGHFKVVLSEKALPQRLV